MPRTKIVCTIGPASESEPILRRLIETGMSVARLNFSHGTHQEHLEKIQTIRRLSDEMRRPVAILQDLCGPKIRVGEAPEAGLTLRSGERFILTSEPIFGNEDRISVSYPPLPGEVSAGDRILLADGMMELQVEQTTVTEIHTRVITGGVLTSHKGINLPSGTIRAEALTAKDREDLRFGMENDVDYVAMSFVRSAEDIQTAAEIIKEAGKQIPVIAKIEKHEALDNIEAILAASDGIMVARGDLGVEIPLENVPQIQKMLVQKANRRGKPVIIATQMLRSMVDSPRPTRAEATDVANGVLDGADAVMLSEETATGDYPVAAVEFMGRITRTAIRNFDHPRYLAYTPEKDVSESVAYAACILADHLDAAAIVATTRSGSTARQISRFKPKPPIIALSPDKTVVRRLGLYWGCYPSLIDDPQDTDARIEMAAHAALDTGMVKKGDIVVITAGQPVWAAGTTNVLRVKIL